MRHTRFQRAEVNSQSVQFAQGRFAGRLAGLAVAALVVADPTGGLAVDAHSTPLRVALRQQPGVGRILHLLDGKVVRMYRFFL